MIAETPETSGQAPLESRETKAVNITRRLSEELREKNRELLNYGAIAVAAMATLLLIFVFTISFRYTHSILLSNYHVIFDVVHSVSCFVVSIRAFYCMIRFDALNKSARAIFEGVTQELEARERLSSRTRGRRAGHEEAPSVNGGNRTANPAASLVSRIDAKVALNEYISSRLMPFSMSPKSQLTYMILLVTLFVFALFSPVIPLPGAPR